MSTGRPDIVIKKLDESEIQIKAERHIIRELSDEFMFEAPGAIWSPKHKRNGGPWDGNIRLIHGLSGVTYAGLEKRVLEFADNNGYSYWPSDTEYHDIPSDHADTLFEKYRANDKYEKRDYQMQAVQACLEDKRQLLLSPTSSGKSFIIYMIVRWLTEVHNKKFLIVVPSVGLVSQFYKDINEYSDGALKMHQIYEGQEKDIPDGCNIVISTWQSIFKMPKKWLMQFDGVVGDEAHEFAAKSLIGLMEKLEKAEYRYGFTGTIDDTESQVNSLVLEGLFGPLNKVTDTKTLIEDGTLSKLKIKCIVLQHPMIARKEASKKKFTYQDEVKYLVGNEARNKFICDIARLHEGQNGIIFVERKGTHGDLLYEKLQEVENRNIHYIRGGVKVEEREKIRKTIDSSTNNVLLATYGTTSRGVNIVELDYIVLAHSLKSKVRNLQSIGRVLRLNKSGKAVMYDLSDDLSINGKINHGLKHLETRIKLYAQEGFEYSIHKHKLRG